MTKEQERLAELQAERAKLAERLAAVEVELGRVNLKDGAGAAVEELQAAAQERDTVTRVLGAVDQRIEAAQAAVKAAQGRERQERVQVLRVEYGEAVAGVAQATRALSTRIDKAEAVRRKLKAAGDQYTNWIPKQLREAPSQAEDYWARHHVTATGAEPRPTKAELDAAKAEAARRNAKRAVRRQAELYRKAQAEGLGEGNARRRLDVAKERARRHDVDVAAVLGRPTDKLMDKLREAKRAAGI